MHGEIQNGHREESEKITMADREELKTSKNHSSFGRAEDLKKVAFNSGH